MLRLWVKVPAWPLECWVGAVTSSLSSLGARLLSMFRYDFMTKVLLQESTF